MNSAGSPVILPVKKLGHIKYDENGPVRKH